tara:strand:- start:327 stop:518 length:192 start_codon:yes stop_codon:yes gene_type:complete
MGAMKWFMMGVEELINPDKTLKENIEMNKDSKVEVRGEKFGVTQNDIEFAFNKVTNEGDEYGL